MLGRVQPSCVKQHASFGFRCTNLEALKQYPEISSEARQTIGRFFSYQTIMENHNLLMELEEVNNRTEAGTLEAFVTREKTEESQQSKTKNPLKWLYRKICKLFDTGPFDIVAVKYDPSKPEISAKNLVQEAERSLTEQESRKRKIALVG